MPVKIQTNLIRVFIILFIFISTSLFGQTSCSKCNITTIEKIQKNQKNITSDIVLSFLCSFDEVCKNNVEFSQISNETVFDLLNITPNIFLKTLANSQVNAELILKTIESPINDNIDLQSCYNRISELDKSIKYRTKVLEALNKAASKLNMDIKKSQKDEN